jgi:hypothetical protein
MEKLVTHLIIEQRKNECKMLARYIRKLIDQEEEKKSPRWDILIDQIAFDVKYLKPFNEPRSVEKKKVYSQYLEDSFLEDDLQRRIDALEDGSFLSEISSRLGIEESNKEEEEPTLEEQQFQEAVEELHSK